MRFAASTISGVSAAARSRVVIADDHPGVREALTALLGTTFDVVDAVGDGLAAVEAVLRLCPDVVVLDVAMPGLDGFQAASRIAASGSAARIVFLSNYAGDDFVLTGLSKGAFGFVSKLHLSRDLIPAIRRALAGRTFMPSAGVLPRWRRPPGRRHDVQLYRSDGFLTRAVIGFFENALEEGHSIIAVASASHLHALDEELRARHRDVTALTDAGRYSWHESTAVLESILDADGRPDATLFRAALDPLLDRALAAATSSPPHVSMFGEIAPILCARGEFEHMRRLEGIAGDFEAARPLSILCGYSTECLAGDEGLSAHICAAHSTVVPADSSP